VARVVELARGLVPWVGFRPSQRGEDNLKLTTKTGAPTMLVEARDVRSSSKKDIPHSQTSRPQTPRPLRVSTAGIISYRQIEKMTLGLSRDALRISKKARSSKSKVLRVSRHRVILRCRLFKSEGAVAIDRIQGSQEPQGR